MIDIYLTSFYRRHFTSHTVATIHARTAPGTFRLHIYDNGSDKETRDYLIGLLDGSRITSLMLDSRNTGCLYNKVVFHAMTESKSEYYVISDNDVYPPLLDPDWLSQMKQIMDAHPELAILAPQLPPQRLQQPYEVKDDVVYCKAVGNTFKMVRRSAFPVDKMEPRIGEYGDDGMVCKYVEEAGWKTAFCRNIFCYHAGQTKDWGYEREQLDMDPRKKNYGPPFQYHVVDWDTYEPEAVWKI